MGIKRVLVLGVACAGLAACGNTTQEQAIIGGGAGAVTAAVLDGNPFVGAAAGAAANVLFCNQHPEKCY